MKEGRSIRGMWTRCTAAALTAAMLVGPAGAQSVPSSQRTAKSDSSIFRMRVNTDLVLVNVIARDKNGALVKDLKAEDFVLTEDGKQQKIKSFDVETAEVALAGADQRTVTGATGAPKVLTSTAALNEDAARNKRLVVLFFDFSSMQPEDIQRAVSSAQKYVDKQMTDADLVAVLSLATSLRIDQDFTSDRTTLKRALAKYVSTGGQGFDAGQTGDAEGTPDVSASYMPDETEFNEFNSDRKLQAIQSIAQVLARIQQKKSIIYFSNGFNGTGLENRAALRNATNAAVRANVSLYPVDVRGLQALPPTGEAQTASLHGTSAYNGRAVQNDLDANFSTQETLSTIAADTGGKAFLDTNDFSGVFTKVQQDTSSYYVLGFTSNNSSRDGRFRKIAVTVKRPGVKLEYRKGYYAPRDFQHSDREAREQQLEDELASDLPNTDVLVYLAASYFRMGEGKFYVPVSVVVPGSQIPFTSGGDKDKATIDIIGNVQDVQLKHSIGTARETVKLNIDNSQQVRRKNVQYTTGFVLFPGTYKLKFIVRENQTGRMGSFESEITIPELKKVPLRMSSVVLASQRQPAKKSQSPLVRNGEELVPNVAHVFRSDQQLYMLYEVYDPAKQKKEANVQQAANAQPLPKNAVRVLTNVQFFSGKTKVYETPLVEGQQVNVPERGSVAFELNIPLTQLKPGYYVCQVNVIDDAAGTFAFPRTPILIMPAAQPTAASGGGN